MVVAGSTNPAAPIIGEVEARWAVSFVSYWTARLLADVRSRIVDPEFGARPLKRAIQREIQDPLAKQILAGAFAEGDTILIDYNGSEITFSSKK